MITHGLAIVGLSVLFVAGFVAGSLIFTVEKWTRPGGNVGEVKKKQAKLVIEGYKDSDGYFELCSDLFPGQATEGEESSSNHVCYSMFEYGEFGTFELIIDEDFNIIGGKITGKQHR